MKCYCYTNSPDKYVILTDEDLKGITTNEDKTLTIEYFCKPREISDLLIDKSYYLIPEIESEKDYQLLRRAMTSNRVVGISEIVLGTKQELVALFANKSCIIATILFYENEINDLPIIFKHKVEKDKLETLKSDIAYNTKEFDWQSHYDKYQVKLRKLIFDKIPKK